jgi:hypothetical protein
MKLTAELSIERFETSENHDPTSRYRFSATYEVNSVACREVWTLQWNAEKGKIKEIRAENRDICL